jgi:bacillithiol biosynthesis deacetylase BshB1
MAAPAPVLQPCDVLCLGAHPDDVEIAAAGTILLLVESGRTVTIVDVTHGEKGSRGSRAERDAEAAAAAARLGLRERRNLELPDTAVAADDASVQRLVALLRQARPLLLLAPVAHDVHPDHVATAHLAERAFFFAGLRNYAPDLGEPHRPRLLLRYPGNRPVEPTFVVDVARVAAAKAEVLRCYRSQLTPPDRTHLVQGLDVVERAEVRDRFYGAGIGSRAAEAFWTDGPLAVRDPGALLL